MMILMTRRLQTPPPPPRKLAIGATVDAAGSSVQDLGDDDSRTVTCSAGTRATVAGTVAHAIKRGVIAGGSFSVAVDCSPQPEAAPTAAP
jgi:hypothetical protein